MPALIRPRSEWGARFDYLGRARQKPAPARKLGVDLHHSVTLAPDLEAATLAQRQDEVAAMQLLERIGSQRFLSGFSYSVGVMPSGEAWQGQELTAKHTHNGTGDRNRTHAAIVLVGNYSRSRPTVKQLAKVARILATWRKDGTLATISLTPHSASKATDCPGRYARAAIATTVATAKALSLVTRTPKASLVYRQGRKVYASKMRKGQTNSDSVWNVRLALHRQGYRVKPGDDYGTATVAAVRAFQLAQGWRGRDADGIVGPGTAARLDLVWVKD